MWGYWKEGRGGRGKAKIMRWLSIEGFRSQARCLMTEWELLHQVQQLLQSVANEHFERRQGCPGREMPTSLSSPADGFSCESKQLPILGTFLTFSVSIYDSASPFSVFCQFSQFGHFNFSKLVTAITQTVQKIGSAQPFINLRSSYWSILDQWEAQSVLP